VDGSVSTTSLQSDVCKLCVKHAARSVRDYECSEDTADQLKRKIRDARGLTDIDIYNYLTVALP